MSIDTGNDCRALELCGLNYPYFLTTMETSTPACTATHVRGTGGAATEVKKALLITYKWSLLDMNAKVVQHVPRIKLDNLTLLSIDMKTKLVQRVPRINLAGAFHIFVQNNTYLPRDPPKM